ncbi:MAG: extracellular solute-binding protein [Chloroflexota bacterium]
MLRPTFVLFLVTLIVSSACSLFRQKNDLPVAVSPPAASPVAATSIVARTAVPPPPPAETPPLTLWTTSEISPRSEVPGGAELVQQLAEFEDNHPHLAVNVELKTISEPGGTLSYLRVGRPIAPTILPDLVLLPTDELAGAAADQLIFPLDDLLAPELVDDLFPVARALGEADGRLVGYPFALTGLTHLAYNNRTITMTLPTTWDSFVASGQSMVMPAAATQEAGLLVQLYLAAGGSLVNQAGQPSLQVEPLTMALALLGQAREQGVILAESSNVESVAAGWQFFQNGLAPVAQTTPHLFLESRALGFNAGFASLPGPDGPLPPLAQGWAWAISTPNPERQVWAAELLAWLVSGPNLGRWSRQSFNLPARRMAWAEWTATDPYVVFLQREVERAEPFPAVTTPAMLTALGNAVFEVVSLSASPPAAAEKAAAAVRP